MEAVGEASSPDLGSPDGFRAFYRANLASVYGYALRLTAGDRALAEDLTQDAFFALVDELRLGRTQRADVRWLISVTRSRFLDHARRERLGRSKLALLRSTASEVDPEPQGGDVLDRLADLQPLHRAVLVLRYVDGLSVPEVADLVGRGVTSTNSLLARARAELRRAGRGGDDG